MNLDLHHWLTDRLSHPEYHLYCYLALLPIPTYTSAKVIAQDCGMHTTNASRWLNSLQKKQIIACTRGLKAIALEWVLQRPDEPVPAMRIWRDRASRQIKVIHPTHGCHTFDELQLYQFATQHGLTAYHLRKVVDGDRPHHKQWRLAK